MRLRSQSKADARLYDALLAIDITCILFIMGKTKIPMREQKVLGIPLVRDWLYPNYRISLRKLIQRNYMEEETMGRCDQVSKF